MMKKTLAIAAVAICGVFLPAWAGEGYVGASYLESSAETLVTGASRDSSSSGWKIFGGYNFIRYFGAELTYYDLGSFEETTATTSYKTEIEVFDLCARGILPLGERVELFGRLGYSSVAVDRSSRSTGAIPVNTSASGTDWELLYGIGIGVKLGKRFGLRAEYEKWTVETALDAWSVGAVFRFGGS